MLVRLTEELGAERVVSISGSRAWSSASEQLRFMLCSELRSSDQPSRSRLASTRSSSGSSADSQQSTERLKYLSCTVSCAVSSSRTASVDLAANETSPTCICHSGVTWPKGSEVSCSETLAQLIRIVVLAGSCTATPKIEAEAPPLPAAAVSPRPRA